MDRTNAQVAAVVSNFRVLYQHPAMLAKFRHPCSGGLRLVLGDEPSDLFQVILSHIGVPQPGHRLFAPLRGFNLVDRRINFCEHRILARRLTAINLFNTQLNLGSQLFTAHQQTDAINDCRFFRDS